MTTNDGEAIRAGSDQRADARHDRRLEWFRAARFGMFIHWGLYAIPAGLWQGQAISGIGEWLMLRARVPVVEYERLAAPGLSDGTAAVGQRRYCAAARTQGDGAGRSAQQSGAATGPGGGAPCPKCGVFRERQFNNQVYLHSFKWPDTEMPRVFKLSPLTA